MRKDKGLLEAEKIIIKIGSSTLADPQGRVDEDFLKGLAKEVSRLITMGKQVVLVSSGARIAGVSTIGKWSMKEDMAYKQALCAIGQVELMDGYRKVFIEEDLHVAQILLTKNDFENVKGAQNIKNTLVTLLHEGVVPIINENDTVCVDEIKIGDNDMLSARTSNLWGGDLLILLSDIEGIFDKNPHEYDDAKLLEEIDDIYSCESTVHVGNKSSFGTGGIRTKIEAAKMVCPKGTDVVIMKGKGSFTIFEVLQGEGRCTLIKGDKS